MSKMCTSYQSDILHSKVDKCRDCPEYIVIGYEKKPFCMLKSPTGRLVDIEEEVTPDTIPSWCPLPNYTEWVKAEIQSEIEFTIRVRVTPNDAAYNPADITRAIKDTLSKSIKEIEHIIPECAEVSLFASRSRNIKNVGGVIRGC